MPSPVISHSSEGMSKAYSGSMASSAAAQSVYSDCGTSATVSSGPSAFSRSGSPTKTQTALV
jgi:hypothetical protein